MAPVLEIDQLSKHYGDRTAVHDVSLAVSSGEIFGVIGPNGAGKTTTVECAQGLRQPDGGTIQLFGQSLAAGGTALRNRIGSQLQSSGLPDRMTVGEALRLFAGFAAHPADPRTLLREWDLAGHERTAFGALSGGLRQRLFVALALVGQPELVFLDEMTQALDPAARRATWDLVRAVRDRGTTVVLVTHDMEEAQTLCDRLAMIAGGRVVAAGTPAGLVAGSPRGTTVRFTTDAPDLDWLPGVPHVRSVGTTDQRIEVTGEGPVAALVAAALVGRGIVPTDLSVHPPTLEQVYLDLLAADLEPGEPAPPSRATPRSSPTEVAA